MLEVIRSLSVTDEIQVYSAVIQLLSVVVLGGIALFQENIKKWWFNPDLKIDFKFGPPDCHKTEFRDQTNPNNKVSDAYYFRFSIENLGKTHAQLCEVVLEDFSKWNDETRSFEKISRWNPINLRWSSRVSGDEFRTINPGRKVYCNIGHINSKSRDLFILEAYLAPFNQENFFGKGKYKLGISVYCENSRRGTIPKVDIVINWLGKWYDEETMMFRDGITLNLFSGE